MTVFQSKIIERAAYLPDRVRDHIMSAIGPIAEAAEIAQCTYDNAVAGAEKAGSERILGVLRTEANRTREHFDETLNVLCMLASDIISDFESDTPLDAAVPAFVSAPTVRDVPAHRFKLRDLVNVELEIPVIGKVIARSGIIAVCELTQGCYLYDESGGESMLIEAGTQLLSKVDRSGTITPIVMYTKQTQYLSQNMGYALPDNLIVDEGVNGITETIARSSAHAVGFMAKKLPTWISYAFGRVWSDQPHKAPKFKVLRYEQSYRVLVAAPWDYGLEALKKRSLGGERLDVRHEIERVLLGQQTPTVIYGAGVGFEHVLESQLSPFTIKDIMSA